MHDQVDYKISVAGHSSLFQRQDRNFGVYFSIPTTGVNTETGILLLIAGFGGHAESNVYCKMRRAFADKYNLVTIPCNYWGWEFMQAYDGFNIEIAPEKFHQILAVASMEDKLRLGEKISTNNLIEILSHYEMDIPIFVNLNESKANLAEMGPVQANDNLTALLVVIDILIQNGLQMNLGKIIAFGSSHGAYLTHLCNIFSNGLITDILDNSGWIFPKYAEKGNARVLSYQFQKSTFQFIFKYLVTKIIFDPSLWNLNFLYSQNRPKCNIVSFHGSDDSLVNLKEKQKLIKSINGVFYEVNPKNIDIEVFKTTTHGLGADYIKLFDYYMKNKLFTHKKSLSMDNVKILTNKATYEINYDNLVPIFVVS